MRLDKLSIKNLAIGIEEVTAILSHQALQEQPHVVHPSEHTTDPFVLRKFLGTPIEPLGCPAGLGRKVRGMSKAEAYFARSRMYAAAAEVAGHASERVALLEMAQRWARLGEIVERYQVLPDGHDSADHTSAAASRLNPAS
jgi:hypothetical protein